MGVSEGRKQAVVFLDRDGTLNVEVGYIRDLEDLKLVDGACRSIARLNGAGVACVLVTNQTGAARGFYPESHIEALNARLVELLASGGAHLDALYYCPHLPEAAVPEYALACSCRKPATGLAEQAYAEHPELDAGRAYVVGDKATDVELARNLKARAVLVTTGYGADVLAGRYQWQVEPDAVCKDIEAAVDWILADLAAGVSGCAEAD